MVGVVQGGQAQVPAKALETRVAGQAQPEGYQEETGAIIQQSD